MNAPRPAIATLELFYAPKEMFVVVGIQTTTPHLAIIDIERDKESDCPVPLVLKLSALNLSRLHGLLGSTPSQYLHVRFLVQTNHQFVPFIEPLHALITPQNLGCQGSKLVINFSCLPIAAAMWLQAGLSQYPCDCSVVNRGNYCLLNNHLLEASTVPVG